MNKIDLTETSQTVDFKTAIFNQLEASQEYLSSRLLGSEYSTTNLGPYTVPGEILPEIECWGDTPEYSDQKYTVSTRSCSTEEYIFLSNSHYLQLIEYRFDYIRSDELNSFSFANLYGDFYGRTTGISFASREEVTDYHCQSHFVSNHGSTFRTTYCLRELKNYPGLFDFSIKLASIGSPNEGLQASISLGAVRKANAAKIAKSIIEQIKWTP